MEVSLVQYFGKPDIIKRFKQLDDDLLAIAGDKKRIDITIVGGSALLLLDLVGDARVTTDIDVMEVDVLAESLIERYNMNRHVETFRYHMPENWVERRQKIPFQGEVIDIYAPSNEDLAALKLGAYREVDRKDLCDMVESGELDITKLQEIIDNIVELRVNYDDDSEWELFILRFNELKALSGEKGRK